jgi:hypothetical protein
MEHSKAAERPLLVTRWLGHSDLEITLPYLDVVTSQKTRDRVNKSFRALPVEEQPLIFHEGGDQ